MELDILNEARSTEYVKVLQSVPGLKELVDKYQNGISKEEKLFMMEFALHGLAEFSMLSKKHLTSGIHFKDLLSSMFTLSEKEDMDSDL